MNTFIALYRLLLIKGNANSFKLAIMSTYSFLRQGILAIARVQVIISIISYEINMVIKLRLSQARCVEQINTNLLSSVMMLIKHIVYLIISLLLYVIWKMNKAAHTWQGQHGLIIHAILMLNVL